MRIAACGIVLSVTHGNDVGGGGAGAEVPSLSEAAGRPEGPSLRSPGQPALTPGPPFAHTHTSPAAPGRPPDVSASHGPPGRKLSARAANARRDHAPHCRGGAE